jgi:hypothetical protein
MWETLMQRLTVGKAADLLQRLEPDTPADYFARQLRGFVQRGLLEPAEHRGSGRTAAALLGPRELCIARVLSVLSRLGMPLEMLRSAAAGFEYVEGRRQLFKGDVQPDDGFDVAATGILGGEDWSFILKIGMERTAQDGEVGGVQGSFYQKPDLAALQASCLTVMSFPAGRLFRPILLHFMDRQDLARFHSGESSSGSPADRRGSA